MFRFLKSRFSNSQMFVFHLLYFNCSIVEFPQLPCHYFEFPNFHFHFQNWTFSNFKKCGTRLLQPFWNLIFHIYEIIFLKMWSSWLLYCLNDFGIFKSINKGSWGVENPEIMEFGGFGPSHDETEILWYQNGSK